MERLTGDTGRNMLKKIKTEGDMLIFSREKYPHAENSSNPLNFSHITKH